VPVGPHRCVLSHRTTSPRGRRREDRATVQDAVRRTSDLDDTPFAGVARASVRLAEVRLELASGAGDTVHDLLTLADEEVARAGTPWLRALWLADPGTERLVGSPRRDLELHLGRERFATTLAAGQRLGTEEVPALARAATTASA
jgi:hypothetical protein